MKIRDIIDREQETLSMEVFPPKKDTDFEMVKEAALQIAPLETKLYERYIWSGRKH